MNCKKCGVEIAAESAIDGKCARCANKAGASKVNEAIEYGGPTMPPGQPTKLIGMPEPGAIPAEEHERLVTYDDVKEQYEKEIGAIPKKKGHK